MCPLERAAPQRDDPERADPESAGPEGAGRQCADVARARRVPATPLAPGMRRTASFRFGAAEVSDFARLSGDYNPLHFDDGYAQSQGYRGRVVHGALLVAAVSRMVGMELPGRGCAEIGVSLDFHRPLYLDQPAELDAEVAAISAGTGVAELRLAIRSEGRLLARGRASVVLKPPFPSHRETP